MRRCLGAILVLILGFTGCTKEPQPSYAPPTRPPSPQKKLVRYGDLQAPEAKLVDAASLKLEGRLAFATIRFGPTRVATMNADGTNLRQLTNATSPCWSPDGRRLAVTVYFQDERDDICLIDPDGTNLKRLTSSEEMDFDPDWSPDGAHIVFTSKRDGNSQVYSMDADGRNQKKLTGVESAEAPDWSPDGKRIAFRGYRGVPAIQSMAPDGGSVRTLSQEDEVCDFPAWSPDGRRIAFTSHQNGSWSLYVMDADGSNVRRLTGPEASVRNPDWSPDGKMIVYAASYKTETGEDLYAIGTDGATRANLTRSHSGNSQPSWTR